VQKVAAPSHGSFGLQYCYSRYSGSASGVRQWAWIVNDSGRLKNPKVCEERAGSFFGFAANVHYAVDEHPRHPYVDECPLCGRTGEYAGAADLFADVQEPLGLELLCYGTMRGAQIHRVDGTPVSGLLALGEVYDLSIDRLSPSRPDMNVAALAVVLIRPRRFGRTGSRDLRAHPSSESPDISSGNGTVHTVAARSDSEGLLRLLRRRSRRPLRFFSRPTGSRAPRRGP
jgi:hypothetical protein